MDVPLRALEGWGQALLQQLPSNGSSSGKQWASARPGLSHVSQGGAARWAVPGQLRHPSLHVSGPHAAWRRPSTGVTASSASTAAVRGGGLTPATIAASPLASVSASMPTAPARAPAPAPFAASSMATATSPLAAGAASMSAAAQAAATAKAEVGRATWTLLHMLAAQFPDRPSRQQQRDARTLVDCLTRIYPCGDCAEHFAEIVRRDPPAVGSGREFRRWLCGVHNRVNSRLGKPVFNCDLVEARWAPLGCSAEEAAAGEPAAAGAGKGCELLGVGAKGGR
ncbi:hypothetical protein CHLRE_03g173200v5 [Chlamydomonas reinhardtii]|uniref:Sulfhydryl oxidase n=1 Tax=Chlamydomonas reinhardtii TaxID=3055 RepID=A8IEC7_CHLRE|nr:uncharacterized protein CHLRE_03g173200v5 [Chlamydomonas reinhardtii]PNW85134.1 hypothetical protein CHLRE_03g173200v5 [Chlamydomonas reinhardtii]|eukprot:XP_001703298.1 sulfhydryl oxidase [Chlamydomonas reinhardtii]